MKQFQCAQCRHVFVVPDWLGVSIACPKCKAKKLLAMPQGQPEPGESAKTSHQMLFTSLLSRANDNRGIVLGGLTITAVLLLLLVMVTQYLQTAPAAFRSDLPTEGNHLERPRSIYDIALQSTVWVVCDLGSNKYSTGTGSIIDRDNKVVLTNHHVVHEAKGIYVYAPVYDSQGNVIADGSHYLRSQKSNSARVQASDPRRDLALLTLDEPLRGVNGIGFSSRSARPGQNVHTIGNSGEDIEGGLWVYTSGTVRQVYVHVSGVKIIETQNPINSGDSGGPVVGDDGKLVAVTMSYMPDQRLVTRAIDVEEVKEFVDAFRDP